MFKHPLDHPTTIWMGGKAGDLTSKSIDDELDMLRRHTFDSLLNDMIAILIFHAFEHVGFELFDHSGLLVGQDMLEGLLHNPATVHLG